MTDLFTCHRDIASFLHEMKFYILIKKRHIKGKKYINPMNCLEHFRNQTFQRR